MTIKNLLEKSIKILKKNNIEKPVLHAKLLLKYVLKKDNMYLIINDNEEVNKENRDLYLDCVNRLANRRTISVYNELSGIYET